MISSSTLQQNNQNERDSYCLSFSVLEGHLPSANPDFLCLMAIMLISLLLNF